MHASPARGVPLATDGPHQMLLLSRRRAYGLVLLASCLWGTIGTAYHLTGRLVQVDALTAVTLRAGAGAALLWGWLLLTDRSALRVAPRDLPRLIVFGLISIGLMYLALFTAFDLTSVAVGTVLLYLSPAIVTLGAALFLHEALTPRKLTALGATFLGCLLVVEVYQPQNLVGSAFGIACGVVAALAYSIYSLLGKLLLERYRAVTVLAYALLPGAAGLLTVKLLTSPHVWPQPAGLLAIAGYGGLVITIAPFGLYTLALRRLPSSEASIAGTVEPAMAVVLSGLLLGERLAPLQLFGALAILGGVVLLAWPAHTSAIGKKATAAAELGRAESTPGIREAVSGLAAWRQQLGTLLRGRPA
jgi:drug/metabolite transporter (DMT)-like permease